jgi:uncharacterized protein with ParB-like and HNH nuclease domain
MSYSTENRKLSDIFGRGARYIVPRYQRDYVWDKTNWREFYNDIAFTLKNESCIKWSHFLGTIVLNRVVSASSLPGVEDYEIIDGQQRITTVFILTAAIYRRLLEIGTEEAKNRSDYVMNRFLTSVDANYVKTNKLLNSDHVSEINNMLQWCCDVSQPDSNNTYAPAFSYFQTQLKDMTLDDIDGFLGKMMDATVVEIISTDDEEIYNIFEVLNARGCQLKQFELLKNHVLKYLQPRTGDFIDKAKRDWEEIVGLISPHADLDDFINHFVKAYLKKPAANANEVYRLVKEEVDIHELHQFLNDLKEFAQAYSDVLLNNSSEINYFKIKRNKQIRPLLTAIVLQQKRNIVDDALMAKALRLLRNFFFAFNALDLTSNRTDRSIASAAYEVYHARTSVEFRVILTELFVKLVEYIDIEAISSHLLTNNSLHYSTKTQNLKKNSKLVRYVLVEYCNFFQSDLSIISDTMTIEHLVPDDGMSQTTALANLTLTSPDVNQHKLGTKSINEKIKILNEYSNLEANKNLAKFVAADGSFDIVARNQQMAKEFIEKIFPFKPYSFGFDEKSIANYRKQEKLVENDAELHRLLLESGSNFEKKLESDSSLSEAYGRYKVLIEGIHD